MQDQFGPTKMWVVVNVVDAVGIEKAGAPHHAVDS
jgi:hypothetical protein